MKTINCKVTAFFGQYTQYVSIESPKTGMVLTLDESKYIYATRIVGKIMAACTHKDGVNRAVVAFTIPELTLFRDALEQVKDDRKDAMMRDEEDVCIASEETDGECPHCDAKIEARRDQGRGYRLHSYEGGL